MSLGIVGTLALVYAGYTALAVAAAVSIVRKAGYSAWWVATGFVPLVNIVMLFAFAFADWPILKQTRRAATSQRPAGHPGFSYSGHPGFAQPPAAPSGYAPPLARPQPEPQPAQPQYPQGPAPVPRHAAPPYDPHTLYRPLYPPPQP
jgi:hypothetical protein